MGRLIKKFLFPPSKWKDIYHVAIMPCFDKKLEASRKEFLLKSEGISERKEEEKGKKHLCAIREVDCVVTSLEVEELLTKKGVKNLRDYLEGSNLQSSEMSAVDGLESFLPNLRENIRVFSSIVRSPFLYVSKPAFAFCLSFLPRIDSGRKGLPWLLGKCIYRQRPTNIWNKAFFKRSQF